MMPTNRVRTNSIQAIASIVMAGFAVILFRIASATLPVAASQIAQRPYVASALKLLRTIPDKRLIVVVMLIGLSIIGMTAAVPFVLRLFRSWISGLVGDVPIIWFAAAILFFWKAPWTFWSVVILAAAASTLTVASFLLRESFAARPTFKPLEHPLGKAPAAEAQTQNDAKLDRPIKDWTEDRLRRRDFVDAVANLILVEKCSVVGITAAFGEGKSSTLNLLSKTLSSRSDVVVVRFSSWLPGDEQALVTSLFASISAEIRKRYLVFGLEGELRKFAHVLAGTVPTFGRVLSGFFDSPAQSAQLRKLTRILSSIPIRVAVLIDELDRMDRGELLVLLKAIRGVDDLPNLSYVCAFDKRALEKQISPDDEAFGRAYLDKFFPLSLSLPRTDREIIEKYFRRELELLLNRLSALSDERQQKSFNEEVNELWNKDLSSFLTNLRKTKMFINGIATALGSVVEEVNTFDMIVLQAIKTISPETFEFMYDNGPAFFDASLRVRYWHLRYSVDEQRDQSLRTQKVKQHIDGLKEPTRSTVLSLLCTVFPLVRTAFDKDRRVIASRNESNPEDKRQICHPDYFPRYFINQVPDALYSERSLSSLIERLNNSETVSSAEAVVTNEFQSFAANSWKRYNFLQLLARHIDRADDQSAEAVIAWIGTLSSELQDDVLGLGEWGPRASRRLRGGKEISGHAEVRRCRIGFDSFCGVR